MGQSLGGFTTQWYHWEVRRGVASLVEEDAQGLLWKHGSCLLSSFFSFSLLFDSCEVNSFLLLCLSGMELCLMMA